VGYHCPLFGLTPEDLAATAEALLGQAEFIDPLGKFSELIRQAHPSTWTETFAGMRASPWIIGLRQRFF
jgi:hypothetical protein